MQQQQVRLPKMEVHTKHNTAVVSVLEVRFKNELVRVLVHLTKKRTFRSLLVL